MSVPTSRPVVSVPAQPRDREATGAARGKEAGHWSDRPWSKRVGRVLLALLLLALWEYASGRWVDPFFLSKPSQVWARLVRLAGNGELFLHLGVTLQETVLGLLLGMAVGVPAGVLFARSPFLSNIAQPFVMAFYSLPRVSLAPLFILWFGLGLLSKVMLVFTMVVFVAFYNSYQGVKSVDPDLIEMMRSMRASQRQITRWVILPSIRSWVMASLRLNIGMALIGAVIGEMFASSRGLGYYIQYSSGMFDTTGVFTGLLVVMVTAIVLEALLGWLDRGVLTRARFERKRTSSLPPGRGS